MMQKKRSILKRNNIRVNFGIPKEIYGDFEEIYIIEKRKRNYKLLKKAFIIEVLKKGIKEWFNR